MSARDQLKQEMTSLPEAVIERLLVYLHSLPTSPPAMPMNGDHFTNYWSRWYGALGEELWDEPAELPFEKRETW